MSFMYRRLAGKLMLDPHCHILPCIDDGSGSLQISVAMAHMAAQDGIDDILCTPHLTPDSSNLSLLQEWEKLRCHLQQLLDESGIALRLHAGAELMLTPDLVKLVSLSPDLRLAKSQYFLFEINNFIPIQAIYPMLFSAKLADLLPILAHPERYLQVNDNILILEKAVSCGCLLQVTGSSILGRFGKKVQLCAEDICHSFPESVILGSDAHDAQLRLPVLHEAFELLCKKAPQAYQHAVAWGDNFLTAK